MGAYDGRRSLFWCTVMAIADDGEQQEERVVVFDTIQGEIVAERAVDINNYAMAWDRTGGTDTVFVIGTCCTADMRYACPDPWLTACQGSLNMTVGAYRGGDASTLEFIGVVGNSDPPPTEAIYVGCEFTHTLFSKPLCVVFTALLLRK